ncbi:MFS transporter [Anaeromyxobacter paludicola]|uniref:MFS transporter n=1 Tax=Anaeromyxobacter paludicola TaxID=2918171 RepID=A0ABM7X9H5_9BACT|nr:MFS transporter [Anaeromyxobacter paludicola]BDG08505.1 MFS transporter [Anaeromyxobacter paludicola]
MNRLEPAPPSAPAPSGPPPGVLSAAVLVASLGYFVDIYDLLLFSIVRVPSLRALGISGQALIDDGVFLLNTQMAGMLLGGVFWGVLGDRKGRLHILFGSITLYSLATLGNGLVHGLPAYAALRFLAGVGLAGELGAGVTLVSEILPKELRGWGTMLVASVGVSGAVLANVVATRFDWRTAYLIGGGLGLALLLLRVGVAESAVFRRLERQGRAVARGNFLSLFTSWGRFRRYAKTILIGTPTWFVVGILVTFSPEFARALGVTGAVSAGSAVMYCYLGLVIGDFASGALSQLLRSRKKVVVGYLCLVAATVAAWYVVPRGQAPDLLYACCAALGFAAGYWAIFVTVGAEQFGTNLRATVATTVPNFVRGMLVLITSAFQVARAHLGLLGGSALVGAVCVGVALVAAVRLEETFGRDLDYLELDEPLA